jgi:hypothetical protein
MNTKTLVAVRFDLSLYDELKCFSLSKNVPMSTILREGVAI